MRSITMIQPAPWAICYGGKRIVTAPFAPPLSAWGRRIAIHAGPGFDVDAGVGLFVLGYGLPATVPENAIVATARVAGVLDRGPDGQIVLLSMDENPPAWALSDKSLAWFDTDSLNFGWVLDEVVVFRETLKLDVPGDEFFWTLSPGVALAVGQAQAVA